MSDELEAAVRGFRHELEDNGGFSAGEIAMLVETFDRAYAEGVRKAREAVANVDPIDSALMGTDAGLAAIDALGEEQDR